jgi:nephrocystin-3
MNNDRKVLVDHVFPEIRRRCAERGIGFTEVDLRWGITNEEVDKAVKLILGFINALNNDDRDPNYAETVAETDSENRTKQANLKQRLRDYACDIELYNQPDDLKSLLIEPLWEKITNKFPDTLTEQQKLNFEHDAFANSRQRVYIKLQTDFDRLSQHAQSDDAPLIIYGESGSGKTALLANWADEYQEKHSEELVILWKKNCPLLQKQLRINLVNG